MRVEIKTSENASLKALSLLIEISLSINNAHPYADIASENDNMVLFQCMSLILDSDQDNFNPESVFNDIQNDPHAGCFKNRNYP